MSKEQNADDRLQPEEVKATMKDGVLTVTFPKTTATELPARITID
jgi:HSP20 family molecular chaperone IbpA